jgi:hypothetical protein
MPQLTAAEIYAHPEFGKVPWEGKPTEEGFVDVAQGRGGPISIAYEIHGTGPNKLVVSGMISILEAGFSGFFNFSFLTRVAALGRLLGGPLADFSGSWLCFSGHTFNY